MWPYDIITLVVKWVAIIDPTSLSPLALSNRLLFDEVEVWRWRDVTLKVQDEWGSTRLERTMSFLNHRANRPSHIHSLRIKISGKPSYQGINAAFVDLLSQTTRLKALYIEDYLVGSEFQSLEDIYDNITHYIDSERSNEVPQFGWSSLLSPSCISRYSFHLTTCEIKTQSLGTSNANLWNFLLHSEPCKSLRSLALHSYLTHSNAVEIDLSPITQQSKTSPKAIYSSHPAESHDANSGTANVLLPNLQTLYAPLNLLSPVLHVSDISKIRYIALDLEEGENVSSLRSALSLSSLVIQALCVCLDSSDESKLEEIMGILPLAVPNLRWLSFSWDGSPWPAPLYNDNQDPSAPGTSLWEGAKCCEALSSLLHLEFIRFRGAAEENVKHSSEWPSNPDRFAGPSLRVVQSEVYDSSDGEVYGQNDERGRAGEGYWEKWTDVSDATVGYLSGVEGSSAPELMTTDGNWKLHPGVLYVPPLPSSDVITLLVSASHRIGSKLCHTFRFPHLFLVQDPYLEGQFI